MTVGRARERRDRRRLSIRGLGVTCVEVGAMPQRDVGVWPNQRSEVNTVADAWTCGRTRGGVCSGSRFGAIVLGDGATDRFENVFSRAKLLTSSKRC